MDSDRKKLIHFPLKTNELAWAILKWMYVILIGLLHAYFEENSFVKSVPVSTTILCISAEQFKSSFYFLFFSQTCYSESYGEKLNDI